MDADTADHGRSIGRRGLLAGTAAVAGGVLLPGCSNGTPTRATRGAGNSTIAEFTALYEGAGASEVIDPGVGTMFIDEARAKHLYDGLFEVDSTMTPVPRLAESAEPNADGSRWRLKLRDARWHDGSPFTSADVLYTLRRILGRQHQAKSFVAASTLAAIDPGACRAIGERTVELVLTSPSFDLPAMLTSYGTRIVRDRTSRFDHPIGTGPFRFVSFAAGRELTAEANDDYWDGKPRIRTLRILSTDQSSRPAAVQSGQADFADALSPSAAQELRRRDDLEVAATANSGIVYFAMKTDRAPFDHPDVRRAMMHLVDREELIKVALQGQGELSNDVFGRGYRYYADDLPMHQHDPDRARGLLRRAGMRGLRFDLFVAPVAGGFVEAARLFAAQAAKVGVTVEVKVGSKDTYYTEVLTKGAMVMGQSGPLAIPYHFGSRLLSDAPKNVTRWKDPEFDRIYQHAQQTSSDTERARSYHRLHEILHDRGGYIFWATTPWLTAARKGYRNIPAAVPNALDWARFDKVAPR
ncbi:ABC transporter substrate-binding protein [Microlunatus soli]|uniref:Peptide/nickel transport system substrate-binding protein n=1 Tax=Microlunatus soli TaxID=630515 RepID=A0A1H1Z011_9ACTN|nr:ABC transporter substrate-binding protein [Microlunatus soli]SDT27051.1 peptide/nickel transport system substrate-binding protein [Microlunatus soli]